MGILIQEHWLDMSFQSFNPSFEKLSEEALKVEIEQMVSPQVAAVTKQKYLFSQNASCLDEPEGTNVEVNRESNSEMKRKQSEVVSVQHYPNKFQKTGNGNAFKHIKSKKMYGSVLKLSNPQT